MEKFIELTMTAGQKFLISPSKIIAVVPGDNCTYIDCALPERRNGTLGYCVQEGYEQIKCMLNGVFEAV